jgi:hypothetical protein
MARAFEVFEKLGVVKLLDADDIVVCPDKLSIMTYLSEIYKILKR